MVFFSKLQMLGAKISAAKYLFEAAPLQMKRCVSTNSTGIGEGLELHLQPLVQPAGLEAMPYTDEDATFEKFILYRITGK